MYIHDVIGSLRELIFETRKRLEELTTTVHMCIWEIDRIKVDLGVSRETKRPHQQLDLLDELDHEEDRNGLAPTDPL